MSAIIVSKVRMTGHPRKENGDMYEYRCSYDRRYFYGNNIKEIAKTIIEANNNNARVPSKFMPERLDNNTGIYSPIEKYGYDINTLDPIERFKPRIRNFKYYANCNGKDVYGNTIKTLVSNAEGVESDSITIMPMKYNKETKSYDIQPFECGILINIDKNNIILNGGYYKIRFTTGKYALCHVIGKTKLKPLNNKNRNASYANGGDVYIVESKNSIAIINKNIISLVDSITSNEWARGLNL